MSVVQGQTEWIDRRHFSSLFLLQFNYNNNNFNSIAIENHSIEIILCSKNFSQLDKTCSHWQLSPLIMNSQDTILTNAGRPLIFYIINLSVKRKIKQKRPCQTSIANSICDDFFFNIFLLACYVLSRDSTTEEKT
jgi:hypothetical protein